MLGLPTNSLPLFLGGVAFLILGIRSIVHYQKVRAPLTLYMGLTGVIVAIAAFCYSLPFGFATSDATLKFFVSVGDIFYYIGIMLQMRIIWYLGFKQSINFYWLAIPTFVVSAISFGFDLAKLPYSTFGVVNNVAEYPVAEVSQHLLALLTFSGTIVGMLLFREATKQTGKQRWRMFSIGLLFFLGSLTAIYNFLFLQGLNSGSSSLIGYLIILAVFLAGLLFIRKH